MRSNVTHQHGTGPAGSGLEIKNLVGNRPGPAVHNSSTPLSEYAASCTTRICRTQEARYLLVLNSGRDWLLVHGQDSVHTVLFYNGLRAQVHGRDQQLDYFLLVRRQGVRHTTISRRSTRKSFATYATEWVEWYKKSCLLRNQKEPQTTTK
jgi:hypothetical protein